jgi:hypothetical protein
MWSGEIGKLDPDLAPYAAALVDYATLAGYRPRVSSTVRSFSSQAKLYRTYVAGRSRYPAAPPGRSAHNYGWAMDVVLDVGGAGAYRDCGDYWENELGGTWGGRFGNPDEIHFELPDVSSYLHGLSDSDVADLMADYGVQGSPYTDVAAPPPIAAPAAPYEPGLVSKALDEASGSPNALGRVLLGATAFGNRVWDVIW